MSRDLVTVLHGDCLDVLATLPDNSVDSVCTDPPYGLEFMGKEWDRFGATIEPTTDTRNRDGNWTTPPFGGGGQRVRYGVAPGLPFQQWCQLWASECLRVLKPGGHLLSFGGTRTYHRLACAIEDAGFEIRDSITWIYGSGFPKSLDVSKAIDQGAGVEREVLGTSPNWRASKRDREKFGSMEVRGENAGQITAPATDAARQWQGWGTALKPASEPIVVARKPLAGTVAQNVQRYGTGAINVDGCRVGTGGQLRWAQPRDMGYHGGTDSGNAEATTSALGRWPSNVILSHAATPEGADACADGCVQGCPVAELDRQSGIQRDGVVVSERRFAGWEKSGELAPSGKGCGGEGGASRFFPTFRYQAKASSAERVSYAKEGGAAIVYRAMKKRVCNVCGNRTCPPGGEVSGRPWPTCGHDDWLWQEPLDGQPNRVAHPTVKPLELMRWLVRLVTPPDGTVLEPFAGSGTTAEAAMREGFRCIAIEREADYLPLIEARLNRRDPLAPKVVVPPPLAGQLGMFDEGVA